MTNEKETKSTSSDRSLDAKAKQAWRWVMDRKIHIIPVALWIDAALALDFNTALATLAITVNYYLLFLFPGFYRQWKKNHPSS